jgi:hypothetical protein
MWVLVVVAVLGSLPLLAYLGAKKATADRVDSPGS